MNAHFKRKTSDFSHEMTGTWQRKGKLKRETESQQITAQNYATKTKYVQTKIHNTQRKGKLCREEKNNNNKLKLANVAQKKYKSTRDCVEKLILWELCKRLNFKYTTKYYMNRSESIKKMRFIKFSVIVR